MRGGERDRLRVDDSARDRVTDSLSAQLLGASAPVVTSAQLRSLTLVLVASAAAAFLARIGPHLVLPTVVVEIVLGILIGPEVLGWATEGAYIQFLANFGLALLFFFAGLEVVERRSRAARWAGRSRSHSGSGSATCCSSRGSGPRAGSSASRSAPPRSAPWCRS
jgi:hypothetical protein